MIETDSQPAPSGGKGLRALLERIRLAVAFLTIIPVLPRRACTSAQVAASFGWFPLVGFALGAMLCGEDLILSHFFGDALRSVVIVASLALVTGALHLDAIADTADALGAGHDRERALAILRDSRIGSFGTVALFLVLALKIAAIASVAGRTRARAIYLAPGLARWAMVAVSYRLDYLRSEGAGSSLMAGDRYASLALASLVAMLAAVPVLSCRVVGVYAMVVFAAMLLRSGYRRWLGGITGDLAGAAGEIIETLVLIAMAA